MIPLAPRRLVAVVAASIAAALVFHASSPAADPAPAKPATPAKRPAKPAKGDRSDAMDYGPFLNLALNAPGNGDNNTYKAIAIPLGMNEKGEPSHAGRNEASPAAVCFDQDLLRFSAGWTDGFIDYKGVSFHGDHGRNPAIVGTQRWATKKMPGWANPADGSFKDPRTDVSGPLPREWARMKGIYRNGNEVTLAYTVGGVEVFERPGMEKGDDEGEVVFRREFTVAEHKQQLVCNVVNVDKATAKVDGIFATLTSDKGVTAVAAPNLPAGAKLEAADGAIRLVLPPRAQGVGQGAGGSSSASFALLIWSGPADRVAGFTSKVGKRDANDLPSFAVRGGDSLWSQTVETPVTLGKNDAAYTVDTFEPPFKNPYGAIVRFGGFDFLPDGKSAVLSTWQGDVWKVSDISGSPEKVTWRRIASGLFEPLGLKVRDGEIFVHCRDGLWRLKDLNGDGEIDLYEVFNNDVHNNPFFHEFAFDLQTDKEGNFYFAKAGPVNPGGRGFQSPRSDHNGTLMTVSKDGKYLDVIATGFRAPNGIGVNPETGQLTTGDNEGTWVPMCPIHWITPGYFAGVVDTAHRTMKSTNKASDVSERPTPICWMPKNVDNSGGGQVWVPTDKWGPFKGNLLHTSYGTCSLYNVMYEFDRTDGPGKVVPQGGVTRFPLTFNSGINRPRFSPFDGQLYVSGLTGWQSNGAKEAAFHRVRYTGKPVNMANGLHVTPTGIEIKFTSPLDAASVADAGNWSVEQWNYEWAEHYGTESYSVAEPTKKGGKAHDAVEVKSAKLSADGKTVTLTLDKVTPVMQMNIKFNLRAADGQPVKSEIYNTINRVPGSKAVANNGSKVAAAAE